MVYSSFQGCLLDTEGQDLTSLDVHAACRPGTQSPSTLHTPRVGSYSTCVKGYSAVIGGSGDLTLSLLCSLSLLPCNLPLWKQVLFAVWTCVTRRTYSLAPRHLSCNTWPCLC